MPQAEVTIAVEVYQAALPATSRLKRLPPFPQFRDPYRLPHRSLRRERKLAYRARGRRRLQLITHIAARLWRLANRKIDRIRALEAAARDQRRAPARARIMRLQREVSAHLQECVTLLEGVLENKNPPEMARVRLAHYLRKLKPAAAASLFTRLLADTRDPAQRRVYALDLAQLWVGLGRPAAALRVLRAAGTPAESPRARLLWALALWQSAPGSAPLDKAVQRVMEALPTATPALRSVARYHLPALIAGTRDPVRALQAWVRVDAAGVRAARPGAVDAVLQALLDRGALTVARRVVAEASRHGLSCAAALRARIARLAGPWAPRRDPPAAVSWAAQVRARLPALARCYRAAGQPRRAGQLELRVAPDGTVRQARLGGPTATGAPAKRPAPAVARCVVAVARGWSFRPWQAARAVRLRATWRVAGP